MQDRIVKELRLEGVGPIPSPRPHVASISLNRSKIFTPGR
jgi:hypothetical protein